MTPILRNIFNLLRQDKKTALQQMYESGNLLWDNLRAAEFSENNRTPGGIGTYNVNEFLYTLRQIRDCSEHRLDLLVTFRKPDLPFPQQNQNALNSYPEVFFGNEQEILLLKDSLKKKKTLEFGESPVLQFHVYPDDMMEVAVVSAKKTEGGRLININSMEPAIAISDYLREVYPREKIEILEKEASKLIYVKPGIKIERMP